jgi:hypothetical protein
MCPEGVTTTSCSMVSPDSSHVKNGMMLVN